MCWWFGYVYIPQLKFHELIPKIDQNSVYFERSYIFKTNHIGYLFVKFRGVTQVFHPFHEGSQPGIMVTGCASWLAKLLHGHGRRINRARFCDRHFYHTPIQVSYNGSLDGTIPAYQACCNYDQVHHDSELSECDVTVLSDFAGVEVFCFLSHKFVWAAPALIYATMLTCLEHTFCLIQHDDMI